MSKFLIAVITVLLLSGCNNSKNEADKSSLHFSINENDISLLEKAEINFLQFEETDSSLIATITQILQRDRRLFVVGGFTDPVKVFDIDGKFISFVGNRGQGPGEYLGVTGIFNDGNSIVIGDIENQRLMYYDADTYQFQKSIDFPESIYAFACLPTQNDFVVYNLSSEGENSDKYFVVFDRESKIDTAYIDKTFRSGYSTGGLNNIYSFDGKVFGYTPYDPTVYEITPERITPALNIEIADFSFPTVDYLNSISDNGTKIYFKELSQSGYISQYSIAEAGNALVLTVIANQKVYLGLLDKTTGKTSMLPAEKMAEIFKTGTLGPFIAHSIDGNLINILNIGRIREFAENGTELDPRLSELIEGENENPVIMTLSFK